MKKSIPILAVALLMLPFSHLYSQLPDTTLVNQTLRALLVERETFSVTYLHNSSYAYHFDNDVQSGTAEINHNYSMRFAGNLPVFMTKKKTFIATAGINVFRTWYHTGDIVVPNEFGALEDQFANTTLTNDYVSITPGAIYRFNLFNRSAFLMARMNLYGSDFGHISGMSLLSLVNVYLVDDKVKTFGLGLGMSRLNRNHLIFYPMITYNRKVNSNMYFNMMLPYNMHLVYRPHKNAKAKVGFYLDRFATLHEPRVNQQPVMELKDVALYNHVSYSHRLYKPIWIRGRIGHKTIFRSDFSQMRNGEVISNNKPFNYFMGEISISLQF